jgi:nucleoside-diphosphate-sugar epimerase
VRETLRIMMSLAGVSAEVVVRADRLRPHDLETLEGSAGALRARTGWAPRVPLETTLRDLLAYWETRTASPSQT